MENTSGLFDSLFLIIVNFLVKFTDNGNFALVSKSSAINNVGWKLLNLGFQF